MKHRAWYYKYPNQVYACGPMRFDKPMNEREFRKYIRELYTDIPPITRLPKGFECWPAR